MDAKHKKDYEDFIKKQLSEMVRKVHGNISKNQQKRENNVFLIFSDKNAKKYMGMGRSIDSQLGTRLQKISMFASRKKFGDESVPNIITLYNDGDTIKISLASYPLSKGMSQKVYWTEKPIEDLFNKSVRKMYDKGSKSILIKTFTKNSNSTVIADIKNEFKVRDEKKNGIPIDLFILEMGDSNKLIAHSYEIKAGGNLDTKNAVSNANEVNSLGKIFGFCEDNFSKFATCYDGKGDGTPDGAIEKHLDRKQILIGEEFWNEVLEDGFSYNDFIDVYTEAYKKAEVEKILVG